MSLEHIAEMVVRRGDGDSLVASAHGDQITFKVAGDASHGSVVFLEYLSQPGAPGPPPHVHDAHEECFYVVEGELSMLVGDRVIVAREGDFAFAPRGAAHTFWNAGPNACRFVGTFTPAGFDGVFRELRRLAAAGASEPELREVPSRFGTTIVPWPPGTRPARR